MSRLKFYKEARLFKQTTSENNYIIKIVFGKTQKNRVISALAVGGIDVETERVYWCRVNIQRYACKIGGVLRVIVFLEAVIE